MSYASPADLTARFDENTIKDLASDTGEPVADITNDQKVLAALADASGRIDSALTVSRMYTPVDLAALTGNSLALLKRIVCSLAMAYLIERRPEKYGGEGVSAAKKDAEEFIDRLRKGERLFDVEAAKDAGLPEIDGPTTTTYRELNLIPDRTRNFYPVRADRLPLGRTG